MKSVTTRVVCVAAVLLFVGFEPRAQERPAPAPAAPTSSSTDPRVGLKPGLRDAGQAARNMELVTSLPKPSGFFDPKMPSGEPTEPEPDEAAKPESKPDEAAKPAASQPAPAPPPQRSGGLNFANSDLAFSGQHLFTGNFHGFNVYDRSIRRRRSFSPRSCAPAARVMCRSHGNLLVMSVEQTRGRIDCGTQGVDRP